MRKLITVLLSTLALPAFGDVTVAVSDCNVDWCRIAATGDVGARALLTTAVGTFDQLVTDTGAPLPSTPPLGGNADQSYPSIEIVVPLNGWFELDSTDGVSSQEWMGGTVSVNGGAAQQFALSITIHTGTSPEPPTTVTCSPVDADPYSVQICWQDATQNEDGTSFTDLRGTEVSWGAAHPVDCAAAPTCVTVAPGVHEYTMLNLTPGDYVGALRHLNSADIFGEYATAPFTVTDPNPPPPPPTGPRVVPNYTSATVTPNVAVAFGITATGRRSTTVRALVRVGAECTGAPVYRYRNQDYYRFNTADAVWISTANAAVSCSQAQ